MLDSFVRFYLAFSFTLFYISVDLNLGCVMLFRISVKQGHTRTRFMAIIHVCMYL